MGIAAAIAVFAGDVKAVDGGDVKAAAAVDGGGAAAVVVATEVDVSHWTKGMGDADGKKSTTQKKARKLTSVSEDF